MRSVIVIDLRTGQRIPLCIGAQVETACCLCAGCDCCCWQGEARKEGVRQRGRSRERRCVEITLRALAQRVTYAPLPQ